MRYFVFKVKLLTFTWRIKQDRLFLGTIYLSSIVLFWQNQVSPPVLSNKSPRQKAAV